MSVGKCDVVKVIATDLRSRHHDGVDVNLGRRCRCGRQQRGLDARGHLELAMHPLALARDLGQPCLVESDRNGIAEGGRKAYVIAVEPVGYGREQHQRACSLVVAYQRNNNDGAHDVSGDR